MSGGEKRKHEGGAGDAARRNKARFYKGAGASGGTALPHGAFGVLVSADTGRERVTGHNLVELLTEAWEEGLSAKPHAAAPPGEAKAPAPVADDLLRAEAGLSRSERFTLCDAGVKGLIFLRARGGTSPDDTPHMPDLVHRVLTAARASRQSRAKFAQRVLPVETVCYASVAEIVAKVAPLIKRHFGDAEAPTAATKYSVWFESRSCDGLKLDRMDVITAVADLVPKVHTVDLSAPEVTVMVQVVKSVAALAVVRDYHALKKFNLRQLTQPPEAAGGDGAAAE